MKPPNIVALVSILGPCITSHLCVGAISPVNSPGELVGATTVSFDGYPNNTVANTLFADQGVVFTRDDGEEVFLWDWAALGRTTTSPDSVLATIYVFPFNSIWATHLNALFSTPVLTVGAYFGNDQHFSSGDYFFFSSTRVSIYDESDNLLGSVDVAVNNNTSVDQFIGLSSDVPIARARFDNLDSGGDPSPSFGVILDDLLFTPVPEPSSYVLFALSSLVLVMASRRS